MKRSILPFLLTIIAVGIFFPVGRHLKPLLPVLLATLLFFNFYQMRFEKQHFFQREPLLYFLFVLLIAPYPIFLLTQSFSPSFRLGIFLTSITPSALSGAVVVSILKGNRELSVVNIVLYNLLSPFSYTFLTRLYFGTSDLHIPVKNILTKLCLFVVIPFLLSLIFKKLLRFSQLLKTLASYTKYLFLLLVFTAISSASPQLRQVPPRELLMVFIVIVLIAGGFYTFGLVFGGSQESKKALAISMGHKNISLCIWLALSNFDPLAAIPPTAYIITQHIFNSLLIFSFSRQDKG